MGIDTNNLYEMFLDYEGPDKPNFVEKIIIQQNFMKWREKYVEIFNNHIDEWNEEFDSLYPDCELSLDGEITENDILYGRFLNTKAKPLFSRGSQPLIDFEVNDGIMVKDCVGDLIGKFKHKNCIVHMYLKKVGA